MKVWPQDRGERQNPGRIFRAEVGVDFETWQRQVRLMKGVEPLVGGCSVAVGYQEASTFVALFRATFATTPKAWLSALERFRQDS